jgi:hypothetical protein
MKQLIIVTSRPPFFLYCSDFDHHGGGECHAWHILPGRKDDSPRLAVGLAERELKCHRYLDDLLPSPSDASPRAGGAQSGNVEDVYKHRGDTHRVRCTLFHPRNWFHHHSGPR